MAAPIRCSSCNSQHFLICRVSMRHLPLLLFKGWPLDCEECGARQFGPRVEIMRVLLEDVMPLPFESPWRRPIQVRIQGSVINRIGQLVGAIPQPPPQARVHAARQPRQDRASVMPAHPAQFRTTVRPPIEPVASLSVEPELQQVVGAWLWPVSGRGSARA